MLFLLKFIKINHCLIEPHFALQNHKTGKKGRNLHMDFPNSLKVLKTF